MRLGCWFAEVMHWLFL